MGIPVSLSSSNLDLVCAHSVANSEEFVGEHEGEREPDVLTGYKRTRLIRSETLNMCTLQKQRVVRDVPQ